MAEPSCAALAHLAEMAKTMTREVVMQHQKLMIVFDLGGGTFDISIVQLLQDAEIKVIAVEGIN